MKYLFLYLIIVFGLAVFPFQEANAYYQVVDDLSMSYSGATGKAIQNGDTYYYRQEIRIRNTGSEDLTDIGVLWQSVVSGSVFSYDNGSHRWERDKVKVDNVDYGRHWVAGYTYDPIHEKNGVNNYLKISDAIALQPTASAFDQASGMLSATDEVPLYLLGDLNAGAETLFSLYFAQNKSSYTGGGWSIQPVFTCVASVSQVPVPSAIVLLGSGIGIIGWGNSRSRKYRESFFRSPSC